MENKSGPEKSENSPREEERIWKTLERYAEKCVRKEKAGYLQLWKIYQRDPRILPEVMESPCGVYAFMKNEREKGYADEDIRFRCRLSTHSEWYTWIGIVIENRKTGLTQDTSSFKLSFDLRSETKETFLAMKNLERKMQEEEQKAREYLHNEMQELIQCKEDRKILRNRVSELESQDQEEEEEDQEEEEI